MRDTLVRKLKTTTEERRDIVMGMRTLFGILLSVSMFAALPHSIGAATDCRQYGPNHRPAVATDAVVLNGQIRVGECYDPNTQGIQQDAEEAKRYLLTRISDSNTCKVERVTPQIAINGLTPSFAKCAAKFFQAYESKYNTRVKINRAHNTRQCEAELCKNNRGCGGYMNHPAPNSNHVKGFAIDVSAPNQRHMMLFAKQNPDFGVCFPFLDHPTFKDDVHMILAGIQSGEARSFGCVGVTKPCDGGSIAPNDIRDVVPTPPPSTSPTSGIANTLRSFLGQPTQPQAMPLAQQPIAAAQNPLGSFTNSPTQVLPQPIPLPAGSSPASRLEELLAQPTTTTASTTKVVPIVVGDTVGTIHSQPSTTIQVPTAQGGGTIAQQTFTTPDLSTLSNMGPQTRAQQILSSLKSILEKMLVLFTPFASRQSAELPAY